MELKEIDTINKNLPALIENTSCTSQFLSNFLAEKTFNKEEVDKITGLVSIKHNNF